MYFSCCASSPLFLLFFFFGWGASLGEDKRGSMRSVLDHVQSYEITYPKWLHPHRHTRSTSKEVSDSGCLT